MGHDGKDTEKGDHKQWGKLSHDRGILAKMGEGAKLFYFCDFFLRNPFFA